MKKSFLHTSIMAGMLLLSFTAHAQKAPELKPPEATGNKLQAVPEPKMPVVSPPVADKDIKSTVSEKLNNSAVNMPKPVKGNDPATPQQARPADVKPVDSRAVPQPAKPVEKPAPQHQ